MNSRFTQHDINELFNMDLSSITLNRKPAKLSGRLCPHATLNTIDGSLPSVEFSWAAVFWVLFDKRGAFTVLT